MMPMMTTATGMNIALDIPELGVMAAWYVAMNICAS
jgi:hypothetical protein